MNHESENLNIIVNADGANYGISRQKSTGQRHSIRDCRRGYFHINGCGFVLNGCAMYTLSRSASRAKGVFAKFP
jgi:hypothetical protein